MNRIQVAFYILVVMFVIVLIPVGISAYQAYAGSGITAAIGVIGLFTMAIPLLISGGLVFLTKDYKNCSL